MTAATGAAPPLLPERVELSGARRRLFEAALELYGRHGYHAVSVRDLLREIGLQPGALYAHVPSKQHLLFELITIGHAEHRDRLRAALEGAGDDPEAQVRALTEAHVRAHLTYPSLARIVHRESRVLSPEQQAAIHAVRSESEQMLLDVVDRGRARGVFRVEDTFVAVAAIGAMGVRAAEWWTPETGRSIETLAATYAEFAVRLLKG